MSWQECTLGDVMTLKRGHDLPQKRRLEGSVPIVSSSGITGFHNEAKADSPGVVTGRYGTLGEVYFVEQAYWPLNTALYVVDFKGNDPRFVAYFLKNAVAGYKSDKAAVPGVDRNVLHRLKVHLPGRNVQTRIAGILSTYDDLIENNRGRIALLEQAARELYREWFVRLRFPGHEHTNVVAGVPEGWARKTLGEIADANAESYRAKELPDVLNYIDISSVSAGRIVEKKQMTSAEAPGRARRKAKHGDVIWSNVRPNLKAYSLVLNPEEIDVFSTGFTVLSATNVPFTFLYQHVTTDQFVSYLVNQTTGASYPAVRPDDFERAEILIPETSLLEEYHAICEPYYQLIAKLVNQNRQLSQARDLLLPRLMDGRISV